jgi:hypothetical protein
MKAFSFVFLEPGDKVLVVHRRLFEKDRPRFFVGVVEGFNETNGLLKVAGHSFGLARTGGLSKKREPRTKILSLTAGTLIVYQLPQGADLAKTKMTMDQSGSLWLEDGNQLRMDLSEAHSDGDLYVPSERRDL